MYTEKRKYNSPIEVQNNSLFFLHDQLGNALTHELITKQQGIKQAKVNNYFTKILVFRSKNYLHIIYYTFSSISYEYLYYNN